MKEWRQVPFTKEWMKVWYHCQICQFEKLPRQMKFPWEIELELYQRQQPQPAYCVNDQIYVDIFSLIDTNDLHYP